MNSKIYIRNYELFLDASLFSERAKVLVLKFVTCLPDNNFTSPRSNSYLCGLSIGFLKSNPIIAIWPPERHICSFALGTYKCVVNAKKYVKDRVVEDKRLNCDFSQQQISHQPKCNNHSLLSIAARISGRENINSAASDI